MKPVGFYPKLWEYFKMTHNEVCPFCKKDLSTIPFYEELKRGKGHISGMCLLSENAVSPVIGVILMVAITVLLAAIMAAFVFGMAGNIATSHSVAVTFEQVSSVIGGITYQGGQDARNLMQIRATVDNNDYLMNTASEIPDTPLKVGSYMQVPLNPTTASHVSVIGIFNDKSEQVLLDKTV